MGLLEELKGLSLPTERHSWRLRDLSEEKMDAFEEHTNSALKAMEIAQRCIQEDDREGCAQALDEMVAHALKAKEQVA